MTVRSAVESALTGAAPIADRDAATAELAITYAGLIDESAPSAVLAKAIAVIDQQLADAEDDKVHDAWARITVALAEHTVASDLGPKLLATLEALLLTPRSRAAGEKGGLPNAAKTNPLDELALRRAGKSRTPDLDATTP